MSTLSRIANVDLLNLLQHPTYLQFYELQRKILIKPSLDTAISYTPVTTLVEPSSHYKELGLEIASQSKIACVILAGGQASRLGTNLPKGLFPITPLQEKSLFHVHMEKIFALNQTLSCQISVAIMTSPLNDSVIRKFFIDHHYFGLDESSVIFFCQDLAPLVDEDGHWLLHEDGKLALAPDGNGKLFNYLLKEKLLEKWQEKDIEYLSVIPIENPLSDPLNLDLIGRLYESQEELCVRAIKKRSSTEPVGTLAMTENSLTICEYSELPENLPSDLFCWGYPGLFACTLTFAKKCSQVAVEDMTWHIATKEHKGLKVKKFETFIFDLFAQATNRSIYPSKREECFAPLKRAQGEDDIASTQIALQRYYVNIWKTLTNKEAPTCLEISPSLYYPTIALQKKWREKILSNGIFLEEIL